MIFWQAQSGGRRQGVPKMSIAKQSRQSGQALPSREAFALTDLTLENDHSPIMRHSALGFWWFPIMLTKECCHEMYSSFRFLFTMPFLGLDQIVARLFLGPWSRSCRTSTNFHVLYKITSHCRCKMLLKEMLKNKHKSSKRSVSYLGK